MRLRPEILEKVKSGKKTLELRIYDEKRRKIRLGDEIEFSDMNEIGKKARVRVAGLLRYGKFSDLIQDMPAAYLGYKESEKDYLKASMYEIYTPEEEAECGVLGIRMRLVG